MKNIYALISISLFLSFNPIAFAQTTASANSRQDTQMHGMDHGKIPARQHDVGSMQMDNPPPITSNGPPVPDLLKDAATRPPMQLSQFEHLALTSNPTLVQANAIVKQSVAQARQVGLYPNPLVGYQGEQIRGGAFGGGEQGAFIQQNIVLGGKLRLRREIYEQQRQVDQIGVTEQHNRILGDVGQSFYSALAAQETVNARRRLLELAMDAVETAHQLANVGQADAPDILQSEVEAEQAEIDYFTAQRMYLQNFNSLAALVGKPDLLPAPLTGDLENPPPVNEDQVIEQIVRDSPAVKRAQQDIVHAQAELRSAKRESSPDIQLRAGLQENFERLNQGDPKTVGVQAFASAGITLPIFNRNQGNIGAAAADLERAQSEVNRTQLSLRRSAQPLVQSYLSGQMEAVRYKNQMIPRALKAYKLYLEKYQQMGAAYPQVLVSQRTYFQLQISYVNVLEQLWRDAIALQNFTLTDGLRAPTPFGTTSTTLNLANASAGGAQ